MWSWLFTTTTTVVVVARRQYISDLLAVKRKERFGKDFPEEESGSSDPQDAPSDLVSAVFIRESIPWGCSKVS